jgi:septal ring factor EnvC (AmiA/AmiB activator)
MKHLAIIAFFAMVTPALAQQQQPATPTEIAAQIYNITNGWAAIAQQQPSLLKQITDQQKQIADLQKELDALKPKDKPKE